MGFFEKGEWKLLWPFYTQYFVSYLFIIFPVFWILYFESISLSFTQIGFLMSAFALSRFFFEIPTGAIADVYGRKASVLLGNFLAAGALLAFFFITSFESLLVLCFFWGLFETLISGADKAWVTDNLIHHKKEHLLDHYFIKKQSIVSAALVISGVLGALLVQQFGLSVIWLASGFGSLLGFFILLFAPEHKVTKDEKKSFSGLMKQSVESIHYSLKNKSLFLLLLIVFFVAILDDFMVGRIAWMPFLEGLGFPIHAFGYLFSAMVFLGIFTPHLAKPLLKKVGSERKFLMIFFILSALIMLFVIFPQVWAFAVIIFLASMFFHQIAFPISESFFQSFVPAKMRATISSFDMTVYALGSAIGPVLAGWFVDHVGARFTITLGAALMIPVFLIYWFVDDKD